MKNLAFILLFVPFVLMSCLTAPEWPETLNEPMVRDVQDVHISLTLLTPEDLEARHKNLADYFIHYPALFPKKRLVVFEYRSSTEQTEVEFTLDRSYMAAEKSYYAETKEDYIEAWKRFHSDDTKEAAFEKMVDRYMLPDRVFIRPGSDDRGYMVFLLTDRRSTEWELVIQARAKNGDRGNLVFPVTLEQIISDDLEDENTGIFSEE